jgi:hypothetical protein
MKILKQTANAYFLGFVIAAALGLGVGDAFAAGCGACEDFRNLYGINKACAQLDLLDQIQNANGNQIYATFNTQCAAGGNIDQLSAEIQKIRMKYCTTAEDFDKNLPRIVEGLETLKEQNCSGQLRKINTRIESILTGDYCVSAMSGGPTCQDIQRGIIMP